MDALGLYVGGGVVLTTVFRWLGFRFWVEVWVCVEQGIDLSLRETVRISCAQASKVLVVWFRRFDVGALVLEVGMCLCLWV